MNVIEILAKRLKELRQENNYSQYEIADMIGIAQVTYSHYELGRRSVSIQNLVKIAQIYNVSTDYLLGLSDVKIVQNKQIVLNKRICV